MPRLGLITIHGMGETPRNYAEPFFDDLRNHLDDSAWNEMSVLPIYYQDIMQANQEDYYRRVRRRLDWGKLRRFMLFGFCDAASLETQKSGPDSPYSRAQDRILNAFRQMFANLDPGSPVIVVAQSLGCQVLSNYLWDAWPHRQARDGVWKNPPQFAGQNEEEFCRGLGISRLFTTGCNIPLFVTGRHRNQIIAIDKPNTDFEWHNYFDEDDVLGWPLADLSDSYAGLVKDHKMNAGFLTGFTPLSHVKYWEDRDFLRPLSRHIKQLL